MKRQDIAVGLVTVCVGAFAMVIAWRLAFFSAGDVPGPGFFPVLLCGLLIVLGLLLTLTSLRRRAGAVTAERLAPADEDSARRGVSKAWGVPKAWIVWGCFAVGVLLLTVLGFVPAMAVLMAGLVFGVERRLKWGSLVPSVLVPVAVSALFTELLAVSLPVGLLSYGPLGL